MTTGLGAIGGYRSLLFVSERLLFCPTQIIGSRLVTRLAPASAIPHGSVVIHALGYPAGRTAVAGVAVHRRAAHQLRFWNVIGRLCQRALSARRQVAAVVARLACAPRYHGVAHRHRSGKAHL